ncbi:MAG: DUF4332 domain-containing protein, partial [Planctomycetaceae bacterium]|nr:DUF4332 domain-containing protein [Planctomycetaceae bacterium]
IVAELSRYDQRLAEMDLEIEQLELQLAELRRRNSLPSAATGIEARIRAISVRLDRWRTIRGMIAGECDQLQMTDQKERQGFEDLAAIRALVGRLEDRAVALQQYHDRTHGHSAEEVAEHARRLRFLKDETAALCSYVREHETAVSGFESRVQLSVLEGTLQNAERMECLLEDQLEGLRRQLSRAENVLDATVIPAGLVTCDHEIHRTAGATGQPVSPLTIQDLEHRIQQLRSERARLLAARGNREETLHGKRALLDRLRQELANAATLEQIDHLRARISTTDARIEMLEERQRQLNDLEASLKLTIVRLKQRVDPEILSLASRYVRRLTQEECTGIVASEQRTTLLVQTRHQVEPMTISQLSRGTRDQLALALRLALIRTRDRRCGHVPLVLDDVFITSDDVRASEVARLLTELAEDGQQILFFTCQHDVSDVFSRFGADIRTFGHVMEAAPAPVVESPPIPLVVEVPKPVMEAPPAAPPAVQPLVVHVERQEPASNVHNWLYYLEMEHTIEDLYGISLREVEALKAAGIVTIADLTDPSVGEIDRRIQQKGFLIPVARLSALRGQAELTCRVPMLRRSDAALLYAAGIESVLELSRMRPETLFDQVTEFQRSAAGRPFRRNGRLIDRQQAINWSRWGQYSRSLSEARSTRSRFAQEQDRTERPAEGEIHQRKAVRQRSRMIRRRRRNGAALTVARPRLGTSPESRMRRARRLARRRRSVRRENLQLRSGSTPERGRFERQPAERQIVSQAISGSGLKFYLTRSSDVEAAPSIGPRTAELLKEIGVITVEDLLRGSASRVSEQIGRRRITEKVISLWQMQSRLMCDVAELRGHDVQLLVACGIETREQLARQNPGELFALIEPLADSKEGERIIRNGRKPDLAEVTDWINWARLSMGQKAA